MITPRFSLHQDDAFLYINIRAPYCNLKELEIYIEKNDFRFVCAPYYLRLNLPGNIIDNDNSTGKFDSDKGEFDLKYSKQTFAEHFEGLEFITSLLNPSKKSEKTQTVNIEVLSSTTTETDENNTESSSFLSVDNDVDKDDGSRWHVDQKLPDDTDIVINNSAKYGFANQKCDVLRDIENEFNSVFDIREVNKLTLNDRKLLRHDVESMSFSADHYIADYFDDAEIKNVINAENPWTKLNKTEIKFSDKEKDILKDFPNKEYLLETNDIKLILYGLIDILFGYCYDKRTTDFESNCESGWTITKLSSTLCWFDSFNNATDVLTSNFRRSLIYPLYRNYELSNQILKDLIVLVNLGPVFIVKCLIDIFNIYNSSSAEPRYILNDLYIKDYTIFMQKCPKNHLDDIIKEVETVQINENDLNLHLKEIIVDQLKQEHAGNSILQKMAKLNLTRIQSDSDAEHTDSDPTSDSDSSSTSNSESTTTDSDDDLTISDGSCSVGGL